MSCLCPLVSWSWWKENILMAGGKESYRWAPQVSQQSSCNVWGNLPLKENWKTAVATRKRFSVDFKRMVTHRCSLYIRRSVLDSKFTCFLSFPKARGKKRQSGLFPANHVKILDRKASGGSTGPTTSPVTEDVSNNYVLLYPVENI